MRELLFENELQCGARAHTQAMPENQGELPGKIFHCLRDLCLVNGSNYYNKFSLMVKVSRFFKVSCLGWLQ